VLLNIITANYKGLTIFQVPKNKALALFLRVFTGMVCICFIFLQTRVMSFAKAATIITLIQFLLGSLHLLS